MFSQITPGRRCYLVIDVEAAVFGFLQQGAHIVTVVERAGNPECIVRNG